MRKFLLIAALFCRLSVAMAAPPPDLSSTAYWQIAGPPGKVTWVEIHDRADAQTGEIAHVEVLARKKGAPIWEVEHVCPHLAITTEALQRSVLRPYKMGSVYPEAYAMAYDRWKADQQKGTAVVCSTSIQDFLAHR